MTPTTTALPIANDNTTNMTVSTNQAIIPRSLYEPGLGEITLDRVETDTTNAGSMRHVMEENIPAERVQETMKKYGFEAARQANGTPAALKHHLSVTFQTYKETIARQEGPTEAERARTLGAIAHNEENISSMQAKMGRTRQDLDTRIKEKDTEVKGADAKLRAVHDEVLSAPPVSHFMKKILAGLLIMVSALVWMFYTNTVYRALYGMGIDMSDPDAVRNLLSTGASFSLSTLWLGILAVLPALFGFGLMGLALYLHYAWSSENGAVAKKAAVGLVLMTLLVDGLLAHRVHADYLRICNITGNTEGVDEWYSSSQFWLVFLIGFGASMVWGFLLFKYVDQRKAIDPQTILLRKTEAYQAELDKLKAELAKLRQELHDKIEQLESEINQLRIAIIKLRANLEEKIAIIQYDGRLKLCLEAFNAGWHQYLAAMGDAPTAADAVYHEFCDKHFTTVYL